MERLFRFIGTLLLHALLAACGHTPYPHSLLVADSLTATRPDSAVALLQSLAPEMAHAPEATRMYYRLLCIKANDKNYNDQTSDSLILPVLSYYIKKNDRRHLPEAYYYAGRAYAGMGDSPQALDYFRKAIEAMPEEEVSPLKGVIYSQMGTVYSLQHIHQEAMQMYVEAYRYSRLLKDTLSMAYDLMDIARMYRCTPHTDSVLLCYREAYRLAEKIRHERMKYTIRSQQASMYIELKQYDSARICIQPALSAHLIPAEKSSIYSIASEIYHLKGEIDSAAYYYTELLTCGNIYARRAAYKGLADIAIDRGRMEDARHCLKQQMLCEDSIQKRTQTESVQRANALYNYQQREKEIAELKTANLRKRSVILILSIATLAFAIGVWGYTQNKRLLHEQQISKLRAIEEEQRKKSRLHIEESNRKLQELEQKLEEADLDNRTLKELFEKQRESIKYAILQAETEQDQQAQAAAAIRKSPLYKEIKQLLNIGDEERQGKSLMSLEHWKRLEELINICYPHFFNTLHQLYPSFSPFEYHVCLLLKIQLSPTEISKLTDHTKESISAVRRRLYKKLFKKDGTPKDLDNFILSL